NATRALAMHANWRSQAALQALVQFLGDAPRAVDPSDRVSVADAIVEAARFQIKGARQDAILFSALVGMLEDKNEEISTIGANTLMPMRDREFRGDLGRPEKKMPDGGWAAWLQEVTARAAGYRKDYANCPNWKEGAEATFCKGGAYLMGVDPSNGHACSTDPV